MFPGALGALTSGLLALSLAASPTQAAPPEPPGPPRPPSQRVVIAPAPANAPGRYFQHQPRANAYFSDTGLEVRLTPAKRPARKLGWGLVGAQSVVPQPLQPREARFHQLTVPNTVSQPGQPTWGALYYPEASPGVDLWLESREAGVGYSLRAARGSQLARVWLEWRGAQGLRVAEGGRALEVQLADGHLREEGLRCGQERKDGSSYDVPCRYREVRATDTGSWQYLIEVDVKEPGRPAWVDPIIQWSTFIGSLGGETLDGIAVIQGAGTAGDIFIAGSSGDNDFDSLSPVFPGTRFGPGGGSDVVVSRFGPLGELRWISVIGGTGNDIGSSVVIGANGVVYVAGSTGSRGLQTASGTSLQGLSDGFIASLKADKGDQLFSFHYLGGTGDEFIYGLTLGPDGKLYAVGSTSSPTMPGATGTFDGGTDIFVSRLNELGALEKTLRGGGSNTDVGYGITTSVQGDGGTAVYVTGYTESPNFLTPTGNPPSVVNRQAVVVALDSQLSTATWSQLLGGQGQDEAYRVLFVPDPAPARVAVVGTTRSPDFPVFPFMVIPGGSNAFLTTFAANSGSRSFSAVIGGSGDEEGYAITRGTRQSLFVGGTTTSQTLNAGGGFDMTSQDMEGYVLRLVPSGTDYIPEWATFVGGDKADEVRALGFSPQNDLLIGGVTLSTNALQGPPGEDINHAGRADMFLYSLAATDLTPPVRINVLDGIGSDRDEQTSTTTLVASWEFQDPDSPPLQYEVAVGTAPGCTNIAGFESVQDLTSVTLTAPGRMSQLTPGTWYYVTVRATNSVGLQTTSSTNGILVLFADGGIDDPRPPRGGTCPVGPPDGGMPDGGAPDAGSPDGGGADGGVPPPGPEDGDDPESPLGWSCGTPGGPAGLVLLMLLALGVMGARRRS